MDGSHKIKKNIKNKFSTYLRSDVFKDHFIVARTTTIKFQEFIERVVTMRWKESYALYGKPRI